MRSYKDYKRVAGSRSYRSYSSAKIETAVKAEQSDGNMSVLKSSNKYNIPYATLYHKVHHMHSKKPGGQLR